MMKRPMRVWRTGALAVVMAALGQAGAVMVVTDDAMIHEDAPPGRVNVAYFRHRAIRTGQIYARFAVAQIDRRPLQRVRFYSSAALKAAVALGAGALIYPVDRARWLRLAMRHITERTFTRTNITHNHKRGCTTTKTFGKIRTRSFFTHGNQFMLS